MSDSRKLREKSGNILLGLSILLFTISICGVWSIFVFSWGLAVTIVGILPTIFICMSICFSYGAYETYVGVSKEEIDQCDSAKLRKLDGISELFKAFIFWALTISCLWVIFVFCKISTLFLIFVIPFWLCFSGFMIHIDESRNNLMEIKELVKK